MGLMGIQSEDVQKALLKVQSAMALSQGLNAIGEAGDSFNTLGKKAVEAFNKIKVAIGSSGIGLLVIALGAIYAYWDDIKAAVSGVSEEQKKLNAASEKNLKTQKDKLDAVSSQDNILKLQGKSEKDILKIKFAQTDQVIAASEVQIQNNISTTKAQVEAAKRNQEILKGILEFITAPLAVVLHTVDMVGKALGKDFGLESGFYTTISKLVFDPAKIQKDADASIKEQTKALDALKNTQAGYQLALKEIDKKAGDDKKAKDKKAGDDEIAKQKEINEILKSNEEKRLQGQLDSEKLTQEARLALITDEYQKKQQIIAENEQKAIDDELDKLSKGLITQEQYNINRNAIDSLYGQQRADAAKANGEKMTAEEKKNSDDKIRIAKEEADQKKAIQDAVFGALDAGVGFLKQISGKNKGLQKASIIAEGAIGIAKMIIANQTANSLALATPQAVATSGAAAIPVIAFNNIKTALSVATTVAATAKALSAIGAGGGAGGGNIPSGAGGAGGATAPIQPQASATTLNQMAINNAGNQAIKTYVVESDVSGNQERIDRIQRAARIGP